MNIFKVSFCVAVFQVLNCFSSPVIAQDAIQYKYTPPAIATCARAIERNTENLASLEAMGFNRSHLGEYYIGKGRLSYKIMANPNMKWQRRNCHVSLQQVDNDTFGKMSGLIAEALKQEGWQHYSVKKKGRTVSAFRKGVLTIFIKGPFKARNIYAQGNLTITLRDY